MTEKIYDFDQRNDRYGSASVKWDEADRIFKGENLLPLWVADMDFQVPDSVTKALSDRIKHGIYGYTYQTDSYLSAVQKWMEVRHGWTVEKEWICHSPGVVTALNLIVEGFTKRGDKILIQPPVYPPFREVAHNQGRELVTNPLVYHNGRYTIDFDDLERKLSDPSVKLMILCSPHNPVGRVWTKEELLKVAELTQKYNVLVISDEIHEDLTYDGHGHIPFASLSQEVASHTVVCTAPSKTFNLAGLQISNIIISDPSLRKIYQNQQHRFSLSEPNTLGMTAAEAAYRCGGEWLNQCLNYIHGNADYIENYLHAELSDLMLIPLEGTYLGWIDCSRLGLDKVNLQKLMIQKAHVAFNQGYTFGSEGEGFIRMNLACPRTMIEEAMFRLKTAITK